MYELDSCGSGQGTEAEEWKGFVNTVKKLLDYIRGGIYFHHVSN